MKRELQNISRGITKLSLVCVISSFLGACSYQSFVSSFSIGDSKASSTQLNSLQSGSMGIARKVPQPSALAPDSLLSFMPSAAPKLGKWLYLDRKLGRARLMENGALVTEAPFQGASDMQPGVYEIALKQNEASWHASDEYYSRRNIPAPNDGEQNRFLRGALGQYVLYLDDQSPIHSGPVWLKEIGGIRIQHDNMERIFSTLEIGSFVQIR